MPSGEHHGGGRVKIFEKKLAKVRPNSSQSDKQTKLVEQNIARHNPRCERLWSLRLLHKSLYIRSLHHKYKLEIKKVGNALFMRRPQKRQRNTVQIASKWNDLCASVEDRSAKPTLAYRVGQGLQTANVASA
jgi:hypothetical protein